MKAVANLAASMIFALVVLPLTGCAPPDSAPPPATPAAGETPSTETPTQEIAYQEGVHYARVAGADLEAIAGDTIEVTEFFMYSCPHCYNFESYLKPWLANKPDDVTFVRVPAIPYNQMAILHGQAFYAAAALDLLDEVHGELFDAYHVQHNRLNTLEALTEFFVAHGVEARQIEDALLSAQVDGEINAAQELAKRRGLQTVPTVVVNGKYRTDAEMAGGSYPQLLALVDHLIEQERATRPTR